MYRLGLLFLGLVSANDLLKQSDEFQLVNYLLKGYNKNVLPSVPSSKEKWVTFSLYLARIDRLDEKTQVLSSFGWLSASWQDDFLKWDPQRYGGITRIVVRSQNIWLPEISILNSIEQGDDVALDAKFRANVLHTGQVIWAPGLKFKTTCMVDLQYFPFDDQICDIQIINWVYRTDLLNFTLDTPPTNLEAYEESGEWELTNTTGFISDKLLNSTTAKGIPIAVFRLSMRRKPKYFMLHVFPPILIVSMMSFFMFLVPVQTGEKVSLGISILLSFSVLLILISDNMPKTTRAVPLIAVYVSINMCLTAASLILTIILMAIHYRFDPKPVPYWIRLTIIDYLGRVLMIGKNRLRSESSPNERTHLLKNSDGDNKGDKKTDHGINNRNEDAGQVVRLPEDAMFPLRQLVQRYANLAQLEEIRHDWRLVAAILDMFLFSLFASIFILTTITYMVKLKG